MSLSSLLPLIAAMDNNELTLAYQPIYDVRRGDTRSAEALLRWQHPERGVLTAASFLPSELPRGIAKALTKYVLERAIGQCGRWGRAGQPIDVSINVPPSLLLDHAVPELLTATLCDHHVAPPRVTIEITEQASSGDGTAMRPACIALARQGVRLSLDDFGCGESSLKRLKQLQVDEVKIDRVFVGDAVHDPTARHIVDKSAQLAHELGIQVVAEGVETKACFDLMVDLGVDLLQGFYIAAPAAPTQPRSVAARPSIVPGAVSR